MNIRFDHTNLSIRPKAIGRLGPSFVLIETCQSATSKKHVFVNLQTVYHVLP